ncbi:MAG: hypothetical protein HY319_00175 [Armatimonadetes bacterium]|nr:hypothetical protein [Armatimonadota bacterium]
MPSGAAPVALVHGPPDPVWYLGGGIVDYVFDLPPEYHEPAEAPWINVMPEDAWVNILETDTGLVKVTPKAREGQDGEQEPEEPSWAEDGAEDTGPLNPGEPVSILPQRRLPG